MDLVLKVVVFIVVVIVSMDTDVQDVAIMSGCVFSDFGFCKSLSSQLGDRASGAFGATTDRVGG